MFPIPTGITHVVVSNGYVTLVMVGNVIYRFSIQNLRAVESEWVLISLFSASVCVCVNFTLLSTYTL